LELVLEEDESDVSLDVREELSESLVVLDVLSDGLSDHSVLSHENDGLSSEGMSDLGHLSRSNIVDSNDEDVGVLVEELDKSREISGSSSGSVLCPRHLDSNLSV